MAVAPSLPLFRVPSSSIRVWSISDWPRTSIPSTASAISPRTLAIALRTPLPPKRLGSPSRSSTASWAPVDAPEGTAAVPVPYAVVTVTLRVGLPRESSTSSALTPSIGIIGSNSLLLGGGAGRLDVGDGGGVQRQWPCLAEAIVEQPCGVHGQLQVAAHQYHEQVPVPSCRGADQAVAGVVCVTGLEPGGARVGRDQLDECVEE